MRLRTTLPAISVALVVASVVPGTGQDQSSAFQGKECLASEERVDIVDCFEEFLRTSPPDKEVWRSFLRTQSDRLWYDQVERRLFIHRKKPAERPLAADRPTKPGTSERSLAIRGSSEYREVPYLSAGGWLNLVTFRPSLDGHYDVTLQVLGNREIDAARFDRTPLLIAADAAQDPDFYAWLQDEAHAQTPSGDDGRIIHNGDQHNGALARSTFVETLAARARALRAYCAAPSTVGHAVYVLGYTLHAIQDLAAHNGRTAAEHSWNSYCFGGKCQGRTPLEGDPDEIADHVIVAREFSKIYVRELRRILPIACWSAMRSYDGPVVTAREKIQLSKARKGGWDLGYGEYRRYKRLGPAFASLNETEAVQIRWLDEIRWERSTHVARNRLLDRFRDDIVRKALGIEVRQ